MREKEKLRRLQNSKTQKEFIKVTLQKPVFVQIEEKFRERV